MNGTIVLWADHQPGFPTLEHRTPMNNPAVKPDVRAFLEVMEANPRPVFTRELVKQIRMMPADVMASVDQPVGELATVRNLAFPGPAGDIAMRIFDPRASRAPGPVVIFFHGGGSYPLALGPAPGRSGWHAADPDRHGRARSVARRRACLCRPVHRRRRAHHLSGGAGHDPRLLHLSPGDPLRTGGPAEHFERSHGAHSAIASGSTLMALRPIMTMAAPALPRHRENLAAATHFADVAVAIGDVHERRGPGGCRRIAKSPAGRNPFSARGVS